MAGPHRARRAGHASAPLFTLKATDEAVGNLVKKGASEAVARRLLEKAGAGQGRHRRWSAWTRRGPLAMAMGILRLEMGRELKLVDEKAFRFLWVTDFPLFEYDAGDRRYVSLHHPFTAPRGRGRGAARQATPAPCAPRPTTSC